MEHIRQVPGKPHARQCCRGLAQWAGPEGRRHYLTARQMPQALNCGPAVLPAAWPGTRGNEGRDERGGHGRLPAGRAGSTPAACWRPGCVFKRCLSRGEFPRFGCPVGLHVPETGGPSGGGDGLAGDDLEPAVGDPGGRARCPPTCSPKRPTSSARTPRRPAATCRSRSGPKCRSARHLRRQRRPADGTVSVGILAGRRARRSPGARTGGGRRRRLARPRRVPARG